MTAYWINNSSFCPLDKGLLRIEGTVTLEIFGCPNCSTKYVKVVGSSLGNIDSISDGFIKPKQVIAGKIDKKKDPAMILRMCI